MMMLVLQFLQLLLQRLHFFPVFLDSEFWFRAFLAEQERMLALARLFVCFVLFRLLVGFM